MFNLDNVTEKKNDNKDWPYRKLIIGPSGSGKTNYLLSSNILILWMIFMMKLMITTKREKKKF